MTRRTLDKGLLKNIIRHTDAHNKIQEQNEMWKQWELKKQSRKRTHSPEKVRGRMRSDTEPRSMKNVESLKWNQMLVEYEETCKDRWGHSGYKELYPEEFKEHDSNAVNLESQCSSLDEEKKERSSRKKKRKKKHKKEKLKRKRKSNSDLSDSQSDEDHRETKKKKLGISSKHSRTTEKKKKKRKKS